MYEEEGLEGPKSTFEIYKAEAENLSKQGEYRKAIDSFTMALELQSDEKNCLVARSRCYLQLGDTKSALADAEASLNEDKTFHRGVYQKAQSLYFQGDFEMALVYYHRGLKLRPELDEFRLGIQKAQEAIDNSVGAPEKVKLTTEGDLTYFEEQKKAVTGKSAYPAYKKNSQRKAAKSKRVVARTARNEKTVKQLLGELYGDKQYLEKLLQETDSKTDMGKTISDLVEEGLNYLDTRTDFWRQQKPMYARKQECQYKRHSAKLHNSKISPQDYVIRELEKIEDDLSAGRHQEAIKKGKKCLQAIERFSDNDLSDRNELISNLHSCLGNCFLDQGSYAKSLEHHEKDYNIGLKQNIDEAVSRGLDNIGRVHAKKKNYNKAIAVWEKKIPLTKCDLEKTWLFHEIGRSYLELGKHDMAKHYGEKSLAAANSAEDTIWRLQATVLVAQSQLKLGEYHEAIDSFGDSLQLATQQGDKSAVKALKKAMEDVNKKLTRSMENLDLNNIERPETRQSDKSDRDSEIESDDSMSR
ncbi:hypothetical protein ScPMuIL_013128 [Solemya velum]